jgi:thymidylate synthase
MFYNMSKSEYSEEEAYLQLIRDIHTKGEDDEGRNGRVRCIFGASMRFSMKNNKIPILTSKRLAWKTCLKELLWFISGNTNNKTLKAMNVHIWDGNSSREFLDSRGLVHLQEDDLGPIYGFQWRHFNAEYKSCQDDYSNKGIDQLQQIIDALKDPKERKSRRLIMSAWNPEQIGEMALPPCHVLCQFNVIGENKLSCALYQRSGDVGLGVPFNIASYSFLLHLIAHHCDLIPCDFVYFLGNAHIYDDHMSHLLSQINNELYEFPTLSIKNKYDNINQYTLEDFELNNYKHNSSISMKMRV